MNNPYAPPETRGEGPPRQEDWYTEGTTIYVADGAVLPAIDLETGEVSEDLIEVRRKFSVAGTTLALWAVFVCLFNLLPTEWKHVFDTNNDDFDILIVAFFVLIVAHLAVVLWRPKLLGKCVRFKAFETPQAQRKTKRTRLVILLWTFFSVLCCLIPALIYAKTRGMTNQTNFVNIGMATGGASILACIVWQFFRLPKIRYKGFSGKWLRVHGACDEALSHLREIESGRSLHHAE